MTPCVKVNSVSQHDSTIDSGRYTLNSTANTSRQSLSSTGRSSAAANINISGSASHLQQQQTGSSRIRAFLDTVQEREHSRCVHWLYSPMFRSILNLRCRVFSVLHHIRRYDIIFYNSMLSLI